MDVVAGISGILAFVVAALGWLGFAPNGPHIIAKIKERLGERRRKQRDLEANMQLLFKAVNELSADGIKQKELVYDAIGLASDAGRIANDALTRAEFQADRQVTNAKLEGYEGNQAKARKDIDELRAQMKMVILRLNTLDVGLADVRRSVAAPEPMPVAQVPPPPGLVPERVVDPEPKPITKEKASEVIERLRRSAIHPPQRPE